MYQFESDDPVCPKIGKFGHFFYNSFWQFTVFAQDDGGNGLVGYADVQVNLKDINDNAPLFPQGGKYLFSNYCQLGMLTFLQYL